MEGVVEAVNASGGHTLRKAPQESVVLLVGLGVQGDAHAGEMIQHRSRVAKNPDEPNLRQVHLIHAELHEELQAQGFCVQAGEMGENITTRGIDLLGLPAGAQLRLGADAVVEITGLRNPCAQLDTIQDGLMAAVLDRDADGRLIRKAGVMGIVVAGGLVHRHDQIVIQLPPLPHVPLQPV